MMRAMVRSLAVLPIGFVMMGLFVGCDGVTIPGDLLGNVNGNDNSTADRVQTSVYASNTGGASGLAIRPSDGAVFAVRGDGLYGPIAEGDDLSTMTPFGATNLGDADLFDAPPSSAVLAITNTGEFWIGSDCCTTVAVVPPGGGNAVPFLGLFDASEIKPETIALVPTGFQGPPFFPGRLLFGQSTTFSRMVGVDVDGDRGAVDIANPSSLNRNAHHLAFGLDGVLYSSRDATGLTISGFQSINSEGRPTELPGTLGAAGETFVVLASGDMVIRGTFQMSATGSQRGILLYDTAAQTISVGLALLTADVSTADEMVITSDGLTILLSLPNRNEILRVTVNDATGSG